MLQKVSMRQVINSPSELPHLQAMNTYYKNFKETPTLVHPDGTMEPLILPSSSYIVTLVFKAAFEPLSSTELATFSSSRAAFASLNCAVMGVSRDSCHSIKEWFQELGIAVQIPCVSDQVL